MGTLNQGLIELHRVGKNFDGRWVFRDLSFVVRENELVALVGPSGSGKSTLLKLIAKLIEPEEGEVRVSDRHELGMLFQRNALFDSLTCLENLLFPLKERKGLIGSSARERALHFLKSVGLAGTENLYPDEISGGMQKRLGIARALVVEPQIILYDDPTAGLDPITSRTIADLILRLRAEMGSTVVSITNDVQRAYQLGERICLVAQGEILEGGSPTQVRATTHPALRQFIRGESRGPLTQIGDVHVDSV